jgi:hypothetical protein
VNHAAAFSAYASCDDRAEVAKEGYLSAFSFAEDFRARADSWGRLNVRGYDGECWAPWLYWDIDRADKLDAALAEARRLALAIVERFALNDDDLLLFYSGSKGFHIGAPTCLWQPGPSVDFNRIARRFCESLAKRAGMTIDAGVYDKVRPFRGPNTRHPKTGRYKRGLSLDELTGLSIERILTLAESPAPFDVPTPAGRCEQAAADWLDAEQCVKEQAEVRAQRRADIAGNPSLNRQTLEFIRNGASQGDRHRLLFSAAANLKEFSCPPALAHALLTDAAIDCGLPPSEVRRQIDCGLAHVGTPADSPDSSTPAGLTAPPQADAEQLRAQLAGLWNAPPPGAGDAWESEQDRRDAGSLTLDFGANVAGPYGAGGERR